jgi:hypothetical protein
MSRLDYATYPTDYDDLFEATNPESFVKTNHPLYDPEKIVGYLNQKKIWINAARQEIRIKDIDKAYLYNILAWLYNHDKELLFTLALADKLGMPNDSIYNIQDSPLYKKLEARYLKLCGVKPLPDTTI